jgi:sulfide dehydrogenase cytochrome subunit
VRICLQSICAALLGAAVSAASLPACAQGPGQAVRYLAANCANCHGTDGHAQSGMPRLAGVPKAYLSEQLKAFRDGKRPGTIMPQLAKGYTEAELELLAEYFSQQKLR